MRAGVVKLQIAFAHQGGSTPFGKPCYLWEGNSDDSSTHTRYVPLSRGLQHHGGPDYKEPARPAPQSGAATPQGTPATESEFTALFPNAPSKAQSVECFRDFAPDSPIFEVVQKCGSADEDIGSGIFIFVWHMANGATVAIGTPTLKTIGDIKYTSVSGGSSSLIHKNKGPR